MNQVSGGPSTPSRYGIWAETTRDHILAALHEEDPERQRALLIQAANALGAFAAIQNLLDDNGP